MDWNRPIDIYCERMDASFWAEPLNAISNIAFVIAAIIALIQYRRSANRYIETPILIALLGIIGIGSFLFHTVATFWAMLADIFPILFFQIAAIWAYLRHLIGTKMVWRFVLIALFVGLSQSASEFLPPEFLNGSGGYLPSLITMLLIAFVIQKQHPSAAIKMFLAAVIFSVSLIFRSIDMLVCESLHIGVHYMWHILNAVVLYLVIGGLLVRRR